MNCRCSNSRHSSFSNQICRPCRRNALPSNKMHRKVKPNEWWELGAFRIDGNDGKRSFNFCKRRNYPCCFAWTSKFSVNGNWDSKSRGISHSGWLLCCKMCKSFIYTMDSQWIWCNTRSGLCTISGIGIETNKFVNDTNIGRLRFFDKSENLFLPTQKIFWEYPSIEMANAKGVR